MKIKQCFNVVQQESEAPVTVGLLKLPMMQSGAFSLLNISIRRGAP